MVIIFLFEKIVSLRMLKYFLGDTSTWQWKNELLSNFYYTTFSSNLKTTCRNLSQKMMKFPRYESASVCICFLFESKSVALGAFGSTENDGKPSIHSRIVLSQFVLARNQKELPFVRQVLEPNEQLRSQQI